MITWPTTRISTTQTGSAISLIWTAIGMTVNQEPPPG